MRANEAWYQQFSDVTPSPHPAIDAVAGSGHMSRRIVAELGDGLFATEDKPSIVQHYRGAGGTGPCDGDFDAATTTVREKDILERLTCGADPGRYIEAAQSYIDPGFDRLVMQVAGPGPDGSIDFYQRELDARIRQLKPNNARG